MPQMDTNQSPSSERSLIEGFYDTPIQDFDRIEHGKVNKVYRVKLSEGNEEILRFSDARDYPTHADFLSLRLNMYAKEAYAMEVCGKQTSIPVADVLEIGSRGTLGFMRQSLLPGLWGKSDSVLQKCSPGLYRALGQMAFKLSKAEVRGLGEEFDGVKKEFALLRNSDESQECDASKRDRTKELPHDLTWFVVSDWLRSHLEKDFSQKEVQGFIQQTDIVSKVAQRSEACYLCHGDILPQNVLFDTEQERITGLIDWEMGGATPGPHMDLAHTLRWGESERRRDFIDGFVSAGGSLLESDLKLIHAYSYVQALRMYAYGRRHGLDEWAGVQVQYLKEGVHQLLSF